MIGGIALTGGRGSMFGALGGVILLATVDNIINLLNINILYVDFLLGAAILVAVVLITGWPGSSPTTRTCGACSVSGTVSDEIPPRISPAEDAPLLQVDRVSKHFGGVAAVSAASFLVHHNECVALMGGNGAGKSTVVSLLSGVYGQDSGSIFLDGVAAKFEGPAAARSGGVETVFQSLALCENLDAPANLFLGRELYRGLGPFVLRRSAMRAEAKEVLRSYGVSIPDLRVATVSLSGGERQALAFPRAARSRRNCSSSMSQLPPRSGRAWEGPQFDHSDAGRAAVVYRCSSLHTTFRRFVN